jgi:hypothetical protein
MRAARRTEVPDIHEASPEPGNSMILWCCCSSRRQLRQSAAVSSAEHSSHVPRALPLAVLQAASPTRGERLSQQNTTRRTSPNIRNERRVSFPGCAVGAFDFNGRFPRALSFIFYCCLLRCVACCVVVMCAVCCVSALGSRLQRTANCGL